MGATIPRVLVVDDHPVVLSGTQRILKEGGLEVVGAATTAEEAMNLIAASQPDVVLIDVRLRGMSGIELAAQVAREHPAVRTVILSSFGNPNYVKAALKAGAMGYLLKTASAEELISAVRAVALGTFVLDATVSKDLVLEEGVAREPLSAREGEVLELVISGLPNKAIAARLGLSKRTVDTYLAHLFARVNVSSRAALVAWAARHGMIDS